MIKTVSHANIWVRDQDEALDFYTNKLGFEVREDVTVPEFDNFRWLTVGPPEQPDFQLILCKPFAMGGPEVTAQLEDLVSKGAAGGVIFQVDDCRATHAELAGRGVEFTQEPVEQIYGIDAAFRDPSGNQHRVVQRTDQG